MAITFWYSASNHFQIVQTKTVRPLSSRQARTRNLLLVLGLQVITLGHWLYTAERLLSIFHTWCTRQSFTERAQYLFHNAKLAYCHGNCFEFRLNEYAMLSEMIFINTQFVRVSKCEYQFGNGQIRSDSCKYNEEKSWRFPEYRRVRTQLILHEHCWRFQGEFHTVVHHLAPAR